MDSTERISGHMFTEVKDIDGIYLTNAAIRLQVHVEVWTNKGSTKQTKT